MNKTLSIIAFALVLTSSSLMASESCYRLCNSDANKIGAQCQEMRNTCLKLGSTDSKQIEMCLDEVTQCLKSGKEIYEYCRQTCED